MSEIEGRVIFWLKLRYSPCISVYLLREGAFDERDDDPPDDDRDDEPDEDGGDGLLRTLPSFERAGGDPDEDSGAWLGGGLLRTLRSFDRAGGDPDDDSGGVVRLDGGAESLEVFLSDVLRSLVS